MKACFARHHRSGFTLIELTISAALMGLILTAGYLCLSSGIASQKLVESRGDILQSARVTLAMMTADLRAACALSKEIQFLGLDRTLDGMEADNVDFGTHHFTPAAPGEGDFCQMSYFVAREPETGIHALWRRLNPVMGLDPLVGGRREEILRGVHGLKLEYYDGWDWYDEWGDPEGRGKAATSFRERPNLTGLPEAVRITLWVGTGRENSSSTNEPPMVFQAIARLNLAGQASAGGSSETSSGNTRPGGASPSAPNSSE